MMGTEHDAKNMRPLGGVFKQCVALCDGAVLYGDTHPKFALNRLRVLRAKVCSSMTHSWMCNDMHPLLSISLLAMNCYELLLVTPIGSPTWIKMGFQWVFNGL